MEASIKRGISEWEQVESVCYEEELFRADGREMVVSAHLEVKRPVFFDGNKGRPVLELTLEKDRKWTFRFRIPRDGNNEAEKAISVLQAVLEAKEDGFSALDRAQKQYEEEKENTRDDSIGNRKEDSSPPVSLVRRTRSR